MLEILLRIFISMFKKISFVIKMISLVLLVIMCFFVNNGFLIILSGIIIIISLMNKKKNLIYSSFLLMILSIFLGWILGFRIIIKIALIINYLMLIESSLASVDKRLLYDIFLYRKKKNKDGIKRYYEETLKDNYRGELSKYKKYNSGIENNIDKEVIDSSIDHLYLIDKMRFDRFYNKKRIILNKSINYYDKLYISVNILIVIMGIMFGR